jgi:hypothetical protein
MFKKLTTFVDAKDATLRSEVMLMLTKLSGNGALNGIIKTTKAVISADRYCDFDIRQDYKGYYLPQPFSIDDCRNAACELFDTLSGFGYIDCDMRRLDWKLTKSGAKLIDELKAEGDHDEWDRHLPNNQKSYSSISLLSGFLLGLFKANNPKLKRGAFDDGDLTDDELLLYDYEEIFQHNTVLEMAQNYVGYYKRAGLKPRAIYEQLCYLIIRSSGLVHDVYRQIHLDHDEEVIQALGIVLRYCKRTDQQFFLFGLCISMFLPQPDNSAAGDD